MHLTTAVDGQKTKYVLDLISKRTETILRTNFSEESPAHALADLLFHTRTL